MEKKKELNDEQRKLILENKKDINNMIGQIKRKNKWLADDLESEAMAAMAESALRFEVDNEEDASFKTFCFMYVKGKLDQFVKKQKGYYQEGHQLKRAFKVPIDAPISNEDEEASTLADILPSDTYEQMERDIESRDFYNVLRSNLSDDEYELLEAKYGENAGREAIEKIAARKGISTRQVYNLINHIKIKIKKIPCLN